MPDSAAFRVSDKRVAYARRDSKTNPIPIGVWENLPLYMAEPQAILLEALTQNEIAQGKKPAVLWVLSTGGDQRDKIVVPLDYLVHVRDADGRKRPRKTNTITTSRRVGAGALRDTTRYERLHGRVSEGGREGRHFRAWLGAYRVSLMHDGECHRREQPSDFLLSDREAAYPICWRLST